VRATLAAPYVARVIDARGRKMLTAKGTLAEDGAAISLPRRRLAPGRQGLRGL
jgi:hypothetical protein